MIRRLRALWPLSAVALLILTAALLVPRLISAGDAHSALASSEPPAVSQSEPMAAAQTASPLEGTAGEAVAPEPLSAPVQISLPAADQPGGESAAQPSPSPEPESAQGRSRVVLGYYVPYDDSSWASLKARAGGLDYIGAQWASVDACGNVGSQDDLTVRRFAEENGVKVLPSLLTGSGWLNHRLLTDPPTRERFLNEIVRYVEEMDYPGLDLDLEGIRDEDRDAFSAFVADLAGALHERGRILTLAIPAKTTDVRTGWAGPYDYAALGEHADLILLMTYDYSWSTGPAGSIAPQEWVDKVAAYAASQMPPEKVLIGLAFYGYDWNITQGGRARALLHPQAVALASRYGTEIGTDEISRSATFGYTARAGDRVPAPPAVPEEEHEIVSRERPECTVRQPAAPPTPTPRPTPPPATEQEHVVWLEDAASVASKLEIAVRHNVGGVGAWRLGQEDPGVWPHLAAYRSGQ